MERIGKDHSGQKYKKLANGITGGSKMALTWQGIGHEMIGEVDIGNKNRSSSKRKRNF